MLTKYSILIQMLLLMTACTHQPSAMEENSILGSPNNNPVQPLVEGADLHDLVNYIKYLKEIIKEQNQQLNRYIEKEKNITQ